MTRLEPIDIHEVFKAESLGLLTMDEAVHATFIALGLETRSWLTGWLTLSKRLDQAKALMKFDPHSTPRAPMH